jgi:hypothetical protein
MVMPAILKITEDRFSELHDALLRELNPDLNEAAWKQMFLQPWPRDEEHVGYALTDGGQFVGILGTLFSKRTLAGKAAAFCNLHSWYVKEAYRAQSLLLMRPVLALKDHTLTDFTATSRANRISKRLGFLSLCRTARILPPLSGRRSNDDLTLEQVTGTREQQALLEAAGDWQSFVDHRHLDCGHLLIRSPNAYCYLVYSRVTRHRLPYCLVHSLSNPQLFAEHHRPIRAHLLSATRGRYVAFNSSFLEGINIPLSFTVRSNEQLYRPAQVAVGQMDQLYSEMLLLNNSILPSLLGRACTALKPWLPAFVKRAYQLA